MATFFLSLFLGQQSNAQNSTTKFDIAFVLRGYDNSCYYCDSSSFDYQAQEIISSLNKLSFGKIATYKIFNNGIDSRSPINIQSIIDINTLQAALDGWPGTKWDWLRNRTDFWLTVPSNYKPIVKNAIDWMKQTNLDYNSWGTQTPQGIINYEIIRENTIRMGPSSDGDYVYNLKMPLLYNPADFKYTQIVLNSMGKFQGNGAANRIVYLGLLDYYGKEYTDISFQGNYVTFSTRSIDNTGHGLYTSIHEGVHSSGVGTHDIDPEFYNLSVLAGGSGILESMNMLPAWDRYYWTKWLPKSTITTDSTQVSDLKGKGRAVDATLKYIYQVVAGDSLGRGGSYKEKYDGKWYSYLVDKVGTLTFTAGFQNYNQRAPINAVLDVPVNIKIDNTARLYLNHDGSRKSEDLLKYIWIKDSEIIKNSSKYILNDRELVINSISKLDEGFYKCVISNKYGTLTTNSIKMSVACVQPPAPIVKDASYCNNVSSDSLRATTLTGNTLNWYGTNATDGTSSNLTVKPSTSTIGSYSYYVSQTTASGCEGAKAKINVTIQTLPIAPVVLNIALCTGATPNALSTTTLSGNSLVWYGTNETGGSGSITAPTPNTTTAGSTNYFLSQKSLTTGCESSRAKIVVTIKPVPTAPLVKLDAANYLYTGSTGTSWFLGGTLLKDTTQKIFPMTTGSYTAQTNLNGCISGLSLPYNYLVTGTITLKGNNFIKIAPNPFINQVNFDFNVLEYAKLNMDVFEIATGKKVANFQDLTAGMFINLGPLLVGTYIAYVGLAEKVQLSEFQLIK